MEKGTKKVLDMIDEELLNGNEELMTVLSALRGPDSDLDEEKQATTCIVRKKVMPRTYEASVYVNSVQPKLKSAGVNRGGFIFGEDTPEFAIFRDKNVFESRHFRFHAKSAFRILGLEWHKVNE